MTVDRPAAAPLELTVVHIVSASYSGGTWLNMLLGSHSEAFSIGEFKSTRKLGRAVCRLHGDGCPLWSRYDPGGPESPLVQLAALTARRVLVANNSVSELGSPPPGCHVKYIHLVRDGRAVAASYLRKNSGRSALWAARTWGRSVRRNERLLGLVPAGAQTLVVYEEAVRDTARQVERLCEFLGMTYDPAMLQYWREDHCYLGGNLGTQAALRQKRGESPPADPRAAAGDPSAVQWDLEFYQRTDPTRFVDERWKDELSTWQLVAFALAAGRINRKYGYPSSLQRGAAPVRV